MSKAKNLLWTAALAALGTAALYQGLVVRRYTLSTDKWATGRRQRFVVVSDLHSTQFGQRQEKLLALIRSQQPDFILLPGDIVDHHRPCGPAVQLLRGVARIAPSYYVTGNHEYYTRQVPEIQELVEECGVTVLRDSHVRLDTPAGTLLLAGCEDPLRTFRLDSRYRPETAMAAAFARLDCQGAYAVLLSHRPERPQLYRQFAFDLVVSGHAHGGQVRLPGLLNGLYTPDQGWFPHYTGGHYHHQLPHQIVSRGVSFYPMLPRVFNPPEVVVVDVNGK